MFKSLFLFSAFLLVYLVMGLLGNFEIDFSGFFLGNFLAHKVWIFIFLGIGIFWSGKDMIDTNRLGKIFFNILYGFFLIGIISIIFYNIFSQNIGGLNISNHNYLSFFFNFIYNNEFIIILLTIILGSLICYYNKSNIYKIQIDSMKELTDYTSRKIIFESKYQKLSTIPVLKYVFKWMYSEGWGVSIGCIISFLIGCTIIIFLAKNQAIHADDMYTYSAVKGYNLYGEYKLNIIGVDYEFPLLFLYGVTKLYNLGIFLGFSEVFSLRFFNVILTIGILGISFFFLNLYNIRGKFKLISYIFISLNAAIISTLLIARLYPINVFFIIVSIFLLFQLTKTEKVQHKLYYFIGIFFLGILSWFFHRVNTVHILSLLILIFIYFIYLFVSKYKLKGLKYISIIGIISIINIGVLLLLRPNTLHFIQQMMFGNEKVEIINFFQSLLTFFQGINFLFIGIALAGFIFIILQKNFNNKLFFGLNLFFIIFTYIIHKEFLASRTDNIRYLIDVSYIFLIMFLYSFFYIFKVLGKRIYITLLVIFIPLYLFHNINFLIKTNNKTFSYFQMRNFGLQEKFYLDNNKFNGETLITDLWLPGIEKSNKTYFITSTKNSNLQSINNLGNTTNSSDQYRVETDVNSIINNNYSEKYIAKNFPETEYLYDINQDFIIKNGFLNVMNKNHLQSIIQQDGQVHLLVGFTFFDNWHIDKEKYELRNFILENCKDKVFTTIENEIYINKSLFWKHNNQLMLYCKLN